MPDLPLTTTDRLLAVADIIEFQPDHWDQANWAGTSDVRGPLGLAGRGYDNCGTTRCVAGWAVSLSPAELLADPCLICGSLDCSVGWEMAGSRALGLDIDLSPALFSSGAALDAAEMADALRRIAKIPEGKRDLHHARQVLSLRQLEGLHIPAPLPEAFPAA